MKSIIVSNLVIEDRSKSLPFKCPICKQYFLRKERCVDHIIDTHSSEDIKQYVDDAKVSAEKALKDVQSAQLVIEDRSKSLPFKCPICKQYFLRKESCVDHITKVHSSEEIKQYTDGVKASAEKVLKDLKGMQTLYLQILPSLERR